MARLLGEVRLDPAACGDEKKRRGGGVAGSPPSRRESPALYRSEICGEQGICEIAWYGGPRALSVARRNAPRFLD
jgi:hypothetical protein